MKPLLQILLLLLSTNLYSQGSLNNRDLSIPFGYGEYVGHPTHQGLSFLDFHNQTISPNNPTSASGISIGRNAGSYINDTNGNLLLLSNGCKLYNADLQTISGEEFFFPGDISNLYCNNIIPYFPTSHGSIFLATATHDSIIYFIHKNLKLENTTVYSDTIGFWKLAKDSTGQYSILSVEKTATPLMTPGRLDATLSNSPGEWWITSLGMENNEIITYRVGMNGFSDTVSNPLPLPLPYDISFETSFSSDGTLFTFAGDDGNVWLFDFDKSNGALSNLQLIEFGEIENELIRGIIFSPNNQLIYVTADTVLYQIEIATGISRQIAGHRSFAEDGWPVSIGQMTMGPDCRIYVAPGSATWYLHVIHEPNEVGINCQFQERAIRTLTRLHWAFPKSPIYRNGNNCMDIEWPFPTDTISSTLNIPLQKELPFVQVGPNPGKGDILLEWIRDVNISNAKTQLHLYDAMGKWIKQYSLKLNSPQRLPWSKTSSGIFFWSLHINGKNVQRGKLLRE